MVAARDESSTDSFLTKQPPEGQFVIYTRVHLRFGWWSLLCFLTLGIVLEGMHGFKIQWYLNVSNETRRLMWTLAHAHGTLLALVNVAFGLSLGFMSIKDTWWPRVASPCLLGAGVLLPGGFFLGGIEIYEGDPGRGIYLVPAGAALLLVAVLLTACGRWASSQPAAQPQSVEGGKRKKGKPRRG